MRKFLAIIIVIVAVVSLIFANNYSRGDPEKTYESLYKSEGAQIVSSDERTILEQRIEKALNEECDVKDLFMRVRNKKEVQISVVVLTHSNQIKIFDIISAYPGPMYSLLVSGTAMFWFGDETEQFIDSCDFIINDNEIVMKKENEL